MRQAKLLIPLNLVLGQTLSAKVDLFDTDQHKDQCSDENAGIFANEIHSANRNLITPLTEIKEALK